MESTKVYCGIGSNINPALHIKAALAALDTQLGPLIRSAVYESEAIGFKGAHFLNLVVGFDTTLALQQVVKRLRQIEDQIGRNRSKSRFSSRVIDLDILAYGDLISAEHSLQLPRAEIVDNAYVLKPFAELAPHWQHPVLHKSLVQLWQEYDQDKQNLWPSSAIDSPQLKSRVILKK